MTTSRDLPGVQETTVSDDMSDNVCGVASDRLGYVREIPVTMVVTSVPASDVNRWTTPTWKLDSLVAIGEMGTPSREAAVSQQLGTTSWIWKGYAVHLHEDAGESYWYNLMSETPKVFVVCTVADDDEDDLDEGELRPLLVTASQDEALGHMETDDVVFSMSMPPEIEVNVERFVVATYQPVIKKKRRRKNWSDTDRPDADRGPRR